MPEQPSIPTDPTHFWEWIRVIRRARLGFYDSPTNNPKKWVSHTVVQHVALTAATYGDYPSGENIRPSTGRLARVCDIDERTVRACLRRLAGLGLLQVVVEHRHPGRSGGEGRPAEYRLGLPADLLERVAHLDPDEREVVVPAGAVVPPERKRRTKTAGAARKESGTAGAAPIGSGLSSVDNAVDNTETPGAPRTDSGEAPGLPNKRRVLPAETAGAAPGIHEGSTRPPNQGPNQRPNQDDGSRNLLAEVEGSPAERVEPPVKEIDHVVVEMKPVPQTAPDCAECGAMLDPDGSCFVCSSRPPYAAGFN
jgi:hypothetical protein